MPESLKNSRAFTLMELLSVIAIMSVLIAGAIYYTASYVLWAKQTTDKEIYTVLNDELTRFKSNGGNLAALTAGAPMNDIFAALQTPVVPTGMPTSLAQQFMATGYTFPGRSLQAMGNGQQYCIYQVDQYTGASPGAGVPTSKMPYGAGVGYMSFTSGDAGLNVTTTSGYWTMTFTGNGTTTHASNAGAIYNGVSPGSLTVWASDASGNPSGNITTISIPNGLSFTAINVTGLSNLGSLDLEQLTSLTSLNASGCASLSSLTTYKDTLLASINVSGCIALSTINDEKDTVLTSVNANNCPALTSLINISDASSTAINVTGDKALPAQCTNGSTNFYIDPGDIVTGP